MVVHGPMMFPAPNLFHSRTGVGQVRQEGASSENRLGLDTACSRPNKSVNTQHCDTLPINNFLAIFKNLVAAVHLNKTEND